MQDLIGFLTWILKQEKLTSVRRMENFCLLQATDFHIFLLQPLRSSYIARGISRKRVKSSYFQKVCPRHRSEELFDEKKKIIPENFSILFFFLKKF